MDPVARWRPLVYRARQQSRLRHHWHDPRLCEGVTPLSFPAACALGAARFGEAVERLTQLPGATREDRVTHILAGSFLIAHAPVSRPELSCAGASASIDPPAPLHTAGASSSSAIGIGSGAALPSAPDIIGVPPPTATRTTPCRLTNPTATRYRQQGTSYLTVFNTFAVARSPPACPRHTSHQTRFLVKTGLIIY